MYRNTTKYLLSFLFLCVGILYINTIKVDLSDCDNLIKSQIHVCSIYSNTSQKIVINIDGSKVDNVYVGDFKLETEFLQKSHDMLKKVDFLTQDPRIKTTNISALTDVLEGENVVKVKTLEDSIVFISQKLTYHQYFLLFLLFVIPIVFLIFDVLFYLMKFYKNGVCISFKFIIGTILFLGVAIRLWFVITPQMMHIYQHDALFHIQNIVYYSKNFFNFPDSNWFLEAPQQALYYQITGFIYKLTSFFEIPYIMRIYYVQVFSLILSISSLFIGLKLIRLYTREKLSISIFMVFLSFTPTFVFLSNAINNDVLTFFLGLLSIYYLSLYFKYPSQKYFWFACISILMAAFSKVSAFLYAIYFFIILVMMFINKIISKDKLKKNLFIFTIATLCLFGFTLLKVYIPVKDTFLFVNSAVSSSSAIPNLDFSYFFSFNILSLIESAQSYIHSSSELGNEIRFSLPTFLYGTFLTGEWSYSGFFDKSTFLKLYTQIIYVFGLVYILGTISYLFVYKKNTLLYKTLWIPILINLLLIIKFLGDYPAVYNSDFRYFAPVFSLIGLVSTLGLEKLYTKFSALKNLLIFWIILFSVIQLLWFVSLIMLYR